MTMVAGVEVYNADCIPVIARGALYTDAELDTALAGSVSSILWDDSGSADLERILSGLTTTDFSDRSVRRILDRPPALDNWRVGEGLAEAFLTEHKACEFPWPMGRDLRNPQASPAGTDLVGIQQVDESERPDRFAFGEVKTSEQEQWPPTIMSGRNLGKQMENLRDSTRVKDDLVKYLGHHAAGTQWLVRYQSAATRYLSDPTDVSLFGILVRDVDPKREDLEARAKALSTQCPTETSIELRAIYLPKGVIGLLSRRATEMRGGNDGRN